MNLYELTATYNDLQSRIEEGENLEAILPVISDELDRKAENYGRVIRNMEGTIEAIKAEEDRLAEKRRALQKGVEGLKSDLFASMKATGKDKIKTNLFTFSIQKNGGAAPIVLDVPVEQLPTDLCKIERKANLKAIAEYIKETGDQSYAHIGERGESLRIK